jgi:hypothetical protein
VPKVQVAPTQATNWHWPVALVKWTLKSTIAGKGFLRIVGSWNQSVPTSPNSPPGIRGFGVGFRAETGTARKPSVLGTPWYSSSVQRFAEGRSARKLISRFRMPKVVGELLGTFGIPPNGTVSSRQRNRSRRAGTWICPACSNGKQIDKEQALFVVPRAAYYPQPDRRRG